MGIILISAIDMGFGIGDADGNLLFDLPKDMEHFRSITTNKTVVMGRRTWESLPVKPLPKRKNYVLTRDKNFKVDGRATIIHSIQDVLKMSRFKDVYIIGGGEIYDLFMPYADELFITHVHTVSFNGRTFFPDIDFKTWKPTSLQKHEADDKHSYSFTFATYARVTEKALIEKQENTLSE